MKATLIIRLEPENKQDAIDMATKYHAYKEGMETMHKSGTFGDPEKVNLHWLLTTRRFE